MGNGIGAGGGCYTWAMRSVADSQRDDTRRAMAALSPQARFELGFDLGDRDVDALCAARGLDVAGARAVFARSRRHGRRVSRAHDD